MIKIDIKKLEHSNLNLENTYVISDFDNTITSAESYGSLNVITKSNLLGEEYNKRYAQIVTEYEEKAKATTDFKLKKELWTMHLSEYIKMLKDYNLTKDLLENIIKKSNIRFREEFKNFINYLHDKNIPLIILSSGLGNSIEMFLTMNNVYYDNIYVISNFVKFGQEGKIIEIPQTVVTPVTKDKIIFNKDLESIISYRSNKLVFGDIPDDICMTKIKEEHNTLSIAFANKDSMIEKLCKNFDIVTKDSNIFSILRNLLDKGRIK